MKPLDKFYARKIYKYIHLYTAKSGEVLQVSNVKENKKIFYYLIG